MDSGDCFTGIIAIVVILAVCSCLIPVLLFVVSTCICVGGIYGACVGAGRAVYTYFGAFNQKCH